MIAPDSGNSTAGAAPNRRSVTPSEFSELQILAPPVAATLGVRQRHSWRNCYEKAKAAALSVWPFPKERLRDIFLFIAPNLQLCEVRP